MKNIFHRPLLLAAALLALLGGRLPAQAQTLPAWLWAKQPTLTANGVTTKAKVTANVLLANGESYVAYQHVQALVVAGVSYPGRPFDGTITVVHHAADGTPMGVVLRTEWGQVDELRTDAQGNLYAAGAYGGTLNLISQTSTTPPLAHYNYFVVKWNAAGTVQWLKESREGVAGSTAYRTHLGLGIDAQGRVTIAGTYANGYTGGPLPFSIGGATLPLTTYFNIFAAQFSASGQLNWLKSSDSPFDSETFSSLDVAPNGAIYLTGLGNNPLRWDGALTDVSNAVPAGFWLALDANGSLLTSKGFSCIAPLNIQLEPLVAAGADGTSYLAMPTYYPDFDFDGTTFHLPIITQAGSSNTGFMIFRLGRNGVPQWAQNAAVEYGAYFELTRMVAVNGLVGDAPDKLYLLGTCFTADLTNPALVCGGASLFNVTNNNGNGFALSLDGDTGTPRWVTPVGGGSGYSQVSAVSADAAGQLLIGGRFSTPEVNFGSTRLTVAAGPNNNDDATGFVAKLAERYNQATGRAYHDLNANAAPDAGENGWNGLVVAQQPGGQFLTTAADGTYTAATQLGTYTYSMPTPPRYHTVVPTGPATVTFGTYNNRAAGPDFALQPLANQQDLTVTLTPITRARPGFAVRYRMTCRNIGTVPVAAAELTLTHDPLLAYVSTSQAATHTGQTLTVSLGTLAPGETRQVDVLCQLNITAQLGHVLEATATLNPTTGDLTPADNTELDRLTVTGSYDPNDLAVNYATLTLPQVQAASRPLDYTARFQNLGTDTAFTVVLRDTLPAAVLNLGTLELLSASHTCSWRLAPGGVLTVTFPNIRLPHRAVNTLRSAGYVRFRVVPWVTLAVGDLIPNRVQIHFDFNPALTTNTALTVVGSPTGLPGAAAAEALAGGLWPNPTTGTLHISSEHPTGTSLTLTLTDALGRTLRTAALPAATSTTTDYTFDLHGLAPGLYGIRAAAGGRAWSRRVVVE